MNEEQRTVLAAVARLEEHRSGPVDEYTVARGAGILGGEMDGQTYAQSAERERIRRILDELDEQGLIRLERTGYWRPRTSLAGRRALTGEGPIRGATFTPARATAAMPRGGAVPLSRDEQDDELLLPRQPEEEEERDERAWPAWWPAALRFGDPSSTPLLAGIGLVAALLLVTLVVLAARGSGGDATPTAPATSVAAADRTGTPRPTATSPAAGAAEATTTNPLGAGATASPTRGRGTPAPTPTPKPFGPTLVIANTNNEGVRVFKTPAGERSFAISEGQEVTVIGPDETDSRGNVWKHISYGGQEGWILAEYTKPAEE